MKKIKLIIEVEAPYGTTHYVGNIDDAFVQWYKKDGHKTWKWVWHFDGNRYVGSWEEQNALQTRSLYFDKLPKKLND